MRLGTFGLPNWHGCGVQASAYSTYNPTNDELGEIKCGRLECCTDRDDQASHKDGPPSAENVAQLECGCCADEAAQVVRSDHNTCFQTQRQTESGYDLTNLESWTDAPSPQMSSL